MYRIGFALCANATAYLEGIPDFDESDNLKSIALCDDSRCHMFESENEALDIARKLGYIFTGNPIFVDEQTEWKRIVTY